MAEAAAVGTTPPARLGTKLVYGLGSVAFGIKDGGFQVFLLFFYNQVLGLPATLVGLAAAIAIVTDAVIDPIIGQTSDNWRSRLGRRHPFMYAAALPVAVLFFLLWNPPAWSMWPLFFYLLFTAIALRIAIACYEIPSAALAPELSPDYDQRTSLLAFRFLFGALGNGVMLLIALTFFLVATKAQPTGMLNQHGYSLYGIVAALLMMASILASAFGTQSRVKYMRQLPPQHRPTLRQLVREMYESLSHRSLLMVTIGSLFSGMAIGMGSVFNTYFGTYFWKFTPQQLGALGAGALLATIIAVPLAPVVSRKLDKRRGFILTAFASLFVNNITMVLKLFGLLPPDGSNVLLLIFFISTTIGLALAITSAILAGAMITDVVEDSEMRTGRRSEGLFSASLSFVSKATSALGILLGSSLIDLVNFPKNVAPALIETVAPGAVRNLVLIYVPIQIVLWFIAISMIARYRISREMHEHNLRRLAESATLAEASPIGYEMAAADAPVDGAGHAAAARPAANL